LSTEEGSFSEEETLKNYPPPEKRYSLEKKHLYESSYLLKEDNSSKKSFSLKKCLATRLGAFIIMFGELLGDRGTFIWGE